MDVSVIVTVYNERRSIDALLDSLAQQTRPPDEIVICDGGSSDDTVERIKRHRAACKDGTPIRILIEKGANISRGRNLAIEAAKGPVIAVTDAGTRLSRTWLAELTAAWPEEANDGDGVNNARSDGASRRLRHQPLAVAGFFVPDINTWFETAMAATVLPLVDDIDPNRFLPSSRSVAFLKSAWVRAGKYPEWLDYCEDLIFDLRMNWLQPGQSSSFVWAPSAVVYFRPRGSLSAFWKQYYRYARGDGKADLWRKRHAVRYIVYLVLAPLLTGIGIGSNRYGWLGWIGLAVGGALYCLRPWQRLVAQWRMLSVPQRILAAGAIPVIRVVGDLAKMAGYPAGLWWRWQNRGHKEIFWRPARRGKGSNGADSD